GSVDAERPHRIPPINGGFLAFRPEDRWLVSLWLVQGSLLGRNHRPWRRLPPRFRQRQLRRLVVLQRYALRRFVLADLKRAASYPPLGRGAPSSHKTGRARRIEEIDRHGIVDAAA